uniref:Reverse transcriptase domain-containing protein n=1 Tax=Aegilops tauschii subsp. strangulata TaxID=200361 RepID=A0A453DEV1_AEGTS
MIGLDNFLDSQVQQGKGSDDAVMAISLSAVTGGVSAKAFQLRAWIQGREVLLLVDSGSSNSFVDAQLASQLSGVQPLPKPGRVRVADGGKMLCSNFIPHCGWYSQGHEFFTDLKVLSLGPYDAILGMDWLEEHSPMIVDWRARFLEIPSPAGSLRLVGHDAASTSCETINSIQLQGLCSKGAVSHIIHLCVVVQEPSNPTQTPKCIQAVVDEFPDVFEEPTGLPPRRSCDHRIPLIPGAQPVNVRPCRHKAEHKTEIETQVEELLRSGVIQRSTSPFASPVILVKKKDGTWRLCIDYRHLNALTVVAKFPVPVIEELLDELHGAAWFSKLDLRAGYHQIRLAPGEEYKTAFQTHQGHFEFKVVSFGLAGAPATFIGAVTTTLKPVNRVCVVSFFDDILVFSVSLKDHVI